MNAHAIKSLAIFMLAGLACLAAAGVVRADTEFTYQGSLRQDGEVVNGAFDLKFSLWSAPAGGSQIGSTVVKNGVQVTDGQFTVVLDFGGAAFNNGDRWLEIAVNSLILTPRQWITRTPYAIQTRGIYVNDNETFVGIGRSYSINSYEILGLGNAANDWAGMYVRTGAGGKPFYGYSLDGAQSAYHYVDGATDDWHLVNGGAARLTVRNDGFVGVGRDTRLTGNEVFGIESPAGANTYGGMYIDTLNAGGWPFYGYATDGVSRAWHYYDGATGDWHLNNGGARLTVENSGRVGIGTISPQALLHVNGDYYGQGLMTLHAIGGDGSDGLAYLQAGDTTTTSTVSLILRAKSNSTMRDVMYVGASGAVGIGTNGPAFTLHVDGSAGKPGGGSWSNASDARLKKNIHDLDGALDRLLALRGVTFEYLDPASINELSGERLGVIAQEVEQVFPDWVDTREDGYKAVTFRGFEALTIEALRELREGQGEEIRALRAENAELRDRLARLESVITQLAPPTVAQRP